MELSYRYIAEWMIDHMCECDGETAYDIFFPHSDAVEQIYPNLDGKLVHDYVEEHYDDIADAIEEMGRCTDYGYSTILIFYTYEEKKQAGYYLNHPDEEEADKQAEGVAQ